MIDHPIGLTRHAFERAREMGVDLDEIRETIRNPETDYPGSAKYPGTRKATRGRLAVAYKPGDRPLVITVLWNRLEGR